jgi:hypothetical protein
VKVKLRIGESVQEIEGPSLVLKISGHAGLDLDQAAEIDVRSASDEAQPKVSLLLSPPFRIATHSVSLNTDREIVLTFLEPDKSIEALVRPKPAKRGVVKSKVLDALGNEELTLAEICQRTGLSKHSVECALGRLRGRGLITRVGDKWRKVGVFRKDPKEVRDGRIPVVGDDK